MSCLARSIADSLRIDDDGAFDRLEEEEEQVRGCDRAVVEGGKSEMESGMDEVELDEFEEEEEEVEGESDDPSRGVKEDLTELKQTLTRQFWGVASFLAPPPPPLPPPPLPLQQPVESDRKETDFECKDFVSSGEEGLNLDGGVGLVNDGEFGEESARLEMEGEEGVAEEEEEGVVWDVVGITEEVLTFGRNIAMHPETWLDYPVEEEDDPDGMSSACFC